MPNVTSALYARAINIHTLRMRQWRGATSPFRLHKIGVHSPTQVALQSAHSLGLMGIEGRNSGSGSPHIHNM